MPERRSRILHGVIVSIVVAVLVGAGAALIHNLDRDYLARLFTGVSGEDIASLQRDVHDIRDMLQRGAYVDHSNPDWELKGSGTGSQVALGDLGAPFEKDFTKDERFFYKLEDARISVKSETAVVSADLIQIDRENNTELRGTITGQGP